jgi:predicted ATPase/class 3 adenylate cyclase
MINLIRDMVPNPTGIVTFLFTDIEGSTKMAREFPETWEVMRSRHDQILREAIESNNGFIFQIAGDAFCAAFRNVEEAVRAAVESQITLNHENWGGTPITVRMGIHTGNAELQESGLYHGYLTLSYVQRLMSAGYGGQVLISLATQELIRDELPEGVMLRDMGERLLKDMIRPEYIYQLVIANVPSDFPPIKTVDVAHHNLPAQMTSFIGRKKEMAEIKQILLEYRLVTLTGSGGVGKSRLSLQVGAECLYQFPNGVWLAELAPVTDPALIPQTLLSVFNLREDSHSDGLEILIDYLRDKSVLLVLDNCEHLIEACAQISETLLRACPKLKILAGSREALGIPGEVAYRVPSLNTPDPASLPSWNELEEVDSIRLFIERATIAKPGFILTKDNASSLAQICSRLDGIPLAIELAASRIRVLTPEQIAARLDDRFRLLTSGSRTALPRFQTLRAMIDWSYSLLTDQERTLFRRLAVFVGGWTLEAAELVCADVDPGGILPHDILDLLMRLVDKSLVMTEEVMGETRYYCLETIRQYSREKFFETTEVEWIFKWHLNFFVRFVESADENLKGRDQIIWQNRLAEEQDNLRAALEWGLDRNPDSALRIVGAANLFWTAGGFSAEGFRWTQKALEQAEKIPPSNNITPEQRMVARAKALRGLARLYMSLGDNANAKRVAEESVSLYRQSPDRRGLAFALVILAYPLEFLGERVQAEAALEESYSIARAEDDVYVICRSLNMWARVILDLHQALDLSQQYVEESLGLAKEAGLHSQEAQAFEILGKIATHRNDYAAARAHFRESIRVYQEIGAIFNVTLEKSNLAHLERELGNFADALGYYRETISAFRDIGQTGAVAHQLECFGFIALAQNQNERALQLFAAASTLREQRNTPMMPDEHVYFAEQLKTLREKIYLMKFESIWSQGRAMTMQQAVEFALEAS